MPEYRIFRLDDAGTILGRSETRTFDSDLDAIRETNKSLNGATIEIWDGPRRVATIKSNGQDACGAI